MKLAYIAGKYTGATREDVQRNINDAEAVGKAVLQKGMVPIIPHRITGHWETDPQFAHMGHHDWMNNVCIPMLERCDVVVMCQGWQESKGAVQEHQHASIRNMPILYM